jgi:hypothetical protein
MLKKVLLLAMYYCHFYLPIKLQSYRDQDITSPMSGSSSPGGSQGCRQSSQSRGPAVPAMLVKVTYKYRNVQQALDFSTGTSLGRGDQWTAEEEMNSYIQSPIPPLQTTDMIEYWTVRYKSYFFGLVTEHALEPRHHNMTNNLSPLHRLCTNSGHICAVRTCILIVSRNRHKAAEPDKSPLDGGIYNVEVQFQEISPELHVGVAVSSDCR